MAYLFDTTAVLQEFTDAFRRTKAPISVDFQELAPWIRKGDQFTHQIHSYPAKLVPHIASFFLGCSHLSEQGDTVLDPFCGTGTVALEASLAGRMPWGADANPLALLVAKVKTYPYSVRHLRTATKSILEDARSLKNASDVPVINAHLWYSPRIKGALDSLAGAIHSIRNRQHREFFLVCLSSTARKVSFADPRISVPVRLASKEHYHARLSRQVIERLQWLETADVLHEFNRCCIQNIARIEQANRTMPGRASMQIAGRDARQLFRDENLSRGSRRASLVITSPPYGSAQKYIRASSLGLNWTGLATPEDLRGLEDKSIGRERLRNSPKDEVLPSHYESFLAAVNLVNPLRASLARAYLLELRTALEEIASVVVDGGHIVLVIGNNEVCGHPMRNDEFCVLVLKRLGFRLRLHMLDHIRSRGLMTKRNKTASLISRESVLLLQKE